MTENEIAIKIAELVLKSKEPDHLGDAIKIGVPLIGAIVLAIIGYLSAKKTAEIEKDAQLGVADKNHQSELVVSYEERRAENYSQTIENLDAFAKSLSAYTTLVKNGIEVQAQGKTVSAEQLSYIEKAEGIFYDSFLDLLSAEAKLIVFGQEDLYSQLRKFGEKAQEVYQEVRIGNEALSVDRINEIMIEMRKLRMELLLNIGNVLRAHLDPN